jgi:pyruvate/2-oxoglutarate dehydrogenase complex dihydrolipoamide dehydrogenase (E3) component
LERYDLVIIGGGAAGINALKTAGTLDARVVLTGEHVTLVRRRPDAVPEWRPRLGG